MEAKIYNSQGQETDTLTLPPELFAVPWNADLVHQVILALRANARTTVAATKNRGEVSGGGKKPWRQKGTGRARHGSIRSPLWRGGGVTHGPRPEKNYEQKINQRAKLKALLTVLAQKYRDGEIIWLTDFDFTTIKTKAAVAVLAHLAKIKEFKTLNYRRGRRALVVLPAADEIVFKSFRNLPSVKVMEARNLNPLELLTYHFLIVTQPKANLAALTKRLKHV